MTYVSVSIITSSVFSIFLGRSIVYPDKYTRDIQNVTNKKTPDENIAGSQNINKYYSKSAKPQAVTIWILHGTQSL